MREKLSHKYQIHSKNVIWIVTFGTQLCSNRQQVGKRI